MNALKARLSNELMFLYRALSKSSFGYEKRSFPISAGDVVTISMIMTLLDKSDSEILDSMRKLYPGITRADVIRMRILLKEYSDADITNNDKETELVVSFLEELRSRKTKVSTR